jgi:hypothetical protein
VVVFWCQQSSESPEVENEYRSAIEAQKEVVPVLLDSTPVPPALGAFQWIDFRELGREKHARLGAPGPEAPASPAVRSSAVWRSVLAVGAAVFCAFAAFALLMSRAAAPALPGDPQPVPTPPPPTVNIGGWLLAIAGVAVAILVLMAVKSRRTREQPAAMADQPATGEDKAMADTLEDELRRRLGV